MGYYNNRYLYLESSGIPGSTGDSVFFTSPILDLSNSIIPSLSFYYHMYGSTMGSLRIDVYDGSIWHKNLWQKTGSQHDNGNEPFSLANVNLDMLSGLDSVLIRFVAIKGTGLTGDMAIDDISISEGPLCELPLSHMIDSIAWNSAILKFSGMDSNLYQIYIQYGPRGFDLGIEGILDSTSLDTLLIQGLNSNTRYHYYLGKSCSANDSIRYEGPFDLKTQCGPLPLPFTEEFATYIPNDYTKQFNLPECWSGLSSKIMTGTTYDENAPFAEISWGHGVMRIVGAGSPNNSDTLIVTMPPVKELPQGRIKLTVWAWSYQRRLNYCWDGPCYTPPVTYSQGHLVIGTIGDPNDMSQFHPFDTVTLPTQYLTVLDYYIDSTMGYNHQDEYIAFSYLNNSDPLPQQIFIDGIVISEMPPCAPPRDMETVDADKNSVSFQFVGGGAPYILEWDTIGFSPGTGNMDTIQSEQFSLNNLDPGTSYELYLTRDCNPNDSLSFAFGPFVFNTKPSCDAVAVPYVEDFDQVQGFVSTDSPLNPTCWNDLDSNDARGFAGISGAIIFGMNSIYNLQYDELTNEYSDPNFPLKDVIVHSPEIDSLENGNNYLRFKFLSAAFNANPLYVGTMSDPDDFSSFTYLDTIFPDNFMFREYGLYLDDQHGYNGTDKYIAFKNKSKYDGTIIYVDSVSITLIDSCENPANPSVDSTGLYEVKVSWEENYGENFMIQWRVRGLPIDSAQFDSTTFRKYHFTQLQPGTSYEFYLLNNCPSADSIYWSGPFYFSTACTSMPTPYFTGFDTPSFDIPNCWSEYASQSYHRLGYYYIAYDVLLKANQEDTVALFSPQFEDLDSLNRGVRFKHLAAGNGVNYHTIGSSKFYLASSPVQGSLDQLTILDSIDYKELYPYVSYGPNLREYSYSLSANSNYNGTDEYLVLLFIQQFNETMRLVIDDFEVFKLDTCDPPTDLHASEISQSQAIIEWESLYGSAFELSYGPLGSSPGDANSILHSGLINKTDTLKGLDDNTVYDVFVRDSCSQIWTGPLTIKTECTFKLSGAYTVNHPSGGAKNYTSLDDAIDDLCDCGIDSSVTMSLHANSYNGTYMVDSIPGTDSSKTVVMKGQGINNTTVKRFELTRVEYFTLKQMKIKAASNEAVVVNQVEHLRIDSCEIESPTNTSAAILVTYNGGHSYFVSITNSTVIGGGSNIRFQGGRNVEIRNNTLENSNNVGISLSTTMDGEIVGNHISSTPRGIYLGDQLNISQNEIHSSDIGIWFNGGQNHVENNMIVSQGIGLNLQLGGQVIINNSIRSQTTAIRYGDYHFTPSNVRNNIFYGQHAFKIHRPEPTSGKVGEMDHNIFYATDLVLGYHAEEPIYSLSDFQIDLLGKNMNSLEGDPGFVSTTDLHIMGSLPNDAGDSLNGASVDIDGDIRPSPFGTNIDIGADEFDIPFTDLNTISIITDTAMKCEGWPLLVMAEVKNNGTDTLGIAHFELNAFGQSQSIQKPLNLAPLHSDTIIVGMTNTNAIPGTHTIELIGLVTSDSIQVNDTARVEIVFEDNEVIQVMLGSDSLCSGDSTMFSALNSTNGSFVWVLNSDTIAISNPQDVFWTPPIDANSTLEVHHIPGTAECRMMDTVLSITSVSLPISSFTYSLGNPNSSSLQVSFDASGSMHTDSVLWEFGDGNTGQGSSISHSYTQNGVFEVIAYTFNVCGVDTLSILIPIEGISTEDHTSAHELNVYPNPSKGSFTIEFDSVFEGVLEIFNSSGQRLYLMDIDRQAEVNLDLQLAQGIYLLRVSSNEYATTKQLIIQ
jgi:hypothetical protein